MKTQDNEFRSVLGLTGAMLIFGTIGIFRRYIPLSSAMLACVRGLMGSAFLLVFIRCRGLKLRHGISRKSVLLLVISGIAIGFNWILLFEAYNYTTVATATLCYYMQPTIVILLSPVIFRERLTPKKLLCALAAICGMVLISGIVESGIPTWEEARGIVCGLGAAALYASVVILNKKLPGIDAYEKTVIQLISAAVVLLPYLAVTEDFSALSLTPAALGMIAVVGIVHTGMAYALYFGSMEAVKAQSVAILSYIDPVTALILSAVILHEAMTPLGMAGAALILGAALISEIG